MSVTLRKGSPVYVNVYELDLGFGGYEEGGWYYDIGDFIDCVTVYTREAAELVQQNLRNDQYKTTGNRSNVNYRGGHYSVEISNEIGADYPTETPHYE